MRPYNAIFMDAAADCKAFGSLWGDVLMENYQWGVPDSPEKLKGMKVKMLRDMADAIEKEGAS